MVSFYVYQNVPLQIPASVSSILYGGNWYLRESWSVITIWGVRLALRCKWLSFQLKRATYLLSASWLSCELLYHCKSFPFSSSQVVNRNIQPDTSQQEPSDFQKGWRLPRKFRTFVPLLDNFGDSRMARVKWMSSVHPSLITMVVAIYSTTFIRKSQDWCLS